MPKSIFSVTSIIAYVVGLLAAKSAIADMFQKAIESTGQKFNLTADITEYPTTFHVSIVFMLCTIGVRFYWHAAHIDQNNQFLQEVRRCAIIKVVYEFFLRSIWISSCLFFPIIVSNELFLGINRVTALYVVFTLMYFSLFLWSYTFIDVLETVSNRSYADSSIKRRSFKELIRAMDFASFVLFPIVAVLMFIVSEKSNMPVFMQIGLLISIIIVSILTFFQLAIFIPMAGLFSVWYGVVSRVVQWLFSFCCGVVSRVVRVAGPGRCREKSLFNQKDV